MKTKIFLLLTAAILLLSVNASAQNKKAKATKAVKTEKTVKKVTTKKAPAETPLKGDVNGDGVVDVADIAAIIAIMKNGGGTGGDAPTNNYFLGASPVTKETFTTADLTEYKSTKPSSITVEISDGINYLAVWIYPASWGEPKAMMNLGDNDKTAWCFNDGELTAPAGYSIAYANLWSNTTYELIW